jgi:hypothetical protein
MAIKDQVQRTIACDGPECKNTISFDPQNQEEIAKLPAWLRTTRTVTLGNNQKFTYCSDVCEVKGVTTGNHNVPEPKQVQEAGSVDLQRAIAEKKIADAMKTQSEEQAAPKGTKVTLE